MAPPVARCSNGPTPCWRIFARVIGSPMFLRARVAFARAHLVEKWLLAREPSLVILRGFRTDRFADEHGFAGLPSPRRNFLYCLLSGQDKIGTEALLDQNDRLKGGGNARRH